MSRLIQHRKNDDFAAEMVENFAKRREHFEMYPWHKKALQLLNEQVDDYELLWIFHLDGNNNGKQELLKYFIEAHKFQYFSGDTTRGLVAKLDNKENNGYCFELLNKDQKKHSGFFTFIQGIKDQHVRNPYARSPESLWKYPISSKVVVVSDYMPNLEIYSLPRWVFFHTKLGRVNLNCELQGRRYKCSISSSIQSSNNGYSEIPCRTTDAELYKQYLDIYSDKLENLLFNELAFPKIVGQHRGIVLKMINNFKYLELKAYIEKKGLLEDSIAINTDFIRGQVASPSGMKT